MEQAESPVGLGLSLGFPLRLDSAASGYRTMLTKANRSGGSTRRFRPGLEPVEKRLLMSADVQDLGQFPLRASSTSNSILVRFAEGANESAALNQVLGFVEKSFPNGTRSVVLGRGVSTNAAISMLSKRPDVVYAEPNSVIQKSGDVVPNDPRFNQLWGLNNTNNVDIDAPQAWGITQGAPIIVAVIDSGIDLRNQDLASKVWVNTAEVGGNRRDDDRNGYIDDVSGWNFVNNTANVQDENGHGSHISGVIAAASNNGYGVTGVNWNARIMPLKFLDRFGNGSTDDAVSAIYYAVAKGARVINASWGGQGYSRALFDAIAYASAKNVIFVTAAGNESVNNDANSSYPASYRLANTLSVAAVDRNGNLADFSNWGANSVDIAAPGVSITSTVPGGFASYSGTSMASPYVAGVASLVLSVHPEFSASQVVAAIRSSAKPLKSLQGLVATGGILSASRALTVGVSTALGRPVAEPEPINYNPDSLLRKIMSSDEFFSRSGGNPTGFVTAAYRQVLGRDPEESGLQNSVTYLLTGGSPDAFLKSLMSSPEAARTKVARWFQGYLGRSDSLDVLKGSAGVIGWANLLLQNGGDGALQASLLSSDEYWRRSGSRSDGFTSALYSDVLARRPEADALIAWRRLTSTSARYDGIRSLQNSEEARRVAVARLYQSVLGRSDSISTLIQDAGVIDWANSLTI